VRALCCAPVKRCIPILRVRAFGRLPLKIQQQFYRTFFELVLSAINGLSPSIGGCLLIRGKLPFGMPSERATGRIIHHLALWLNWPSRP
jgi:hypothetical protein